MPASTSGNDRFAAFPSARRQGIGSKPRRALSRPAPPPMDEKAAWRWWRHMRSDDWWQSQMPITTVAMAQALGLPKSTIAAFIRGRDVGPLLVRMARVIPDIERRRVAFLCLGVGWQGSRSMVKWLQPPERPRLLPKVAALEAWDMWACCSTCGRNQFMPVLIDNKPHAACYHCLPPSQYAQIAALRRQGSLIHAVLMPHRD